MMILYTIFQILGIACLSWVLTHFELIQKIRTHIPPDDKLWLLPLQIMAKITQCTKCTAFWFAFCYFMMVTFHPFIDKLFLTAITCIVAEFINTRLSSIKII